MKWLKFLPAAAWWSNMASSFVGALLGIAVTFGTSAWIESRAKQQLAHKMLAITIEYLDSQVDEMERICERLNACDSVLTAVNRHPSDALDKIGEDTLKLFINHLVMFPICLEDNSAERVFNQNVEVWKTIDNLRLQNNITICFSLQRKFFLLFSELNDTRNEILKNVLEKKALSDYKNYRNAVAALLKAPGFHKFLFDLKYKLMQLDLFTETLAAGNENNKLRTGITDDELDRLFLRNGYEDQFATTFHTEKNTNDL